MSNSQKTNSKHNIESEKWLIFFSYRILIVLYAYFVKILMLIVHGQILQSKLNFFFIFLLFIFFSFRNPQELENLIKILITDSVVRKKFPGKNFLPFNFHNDNKSFQNGNFLMNLSIIYYHQINLKKIMHRIS